MTTPQEERTAGQWPGLDFLVANQNALLKQRDDLVAALEKVSEVTELPKHKEDDVVFMRAGIRWASKFAEAALASIRATHTHGET